MGRKMSGRRQKREPKEVDPITLEVVRAFFVNVTREMGATLAHSAWTPTLTETLDFGLGLLSNRGELVAASEYLPFHTFALGFHVRHALEVYGNDIHPGDVFITNDPYTAGPHLNDMVIFHPVFADGELILFIGVRAHWTDVGGKVPGSMVGQAREIYEEGLRIPMVKIYRKGELNTDLWQTILTNCRNPDEREGDFHAMLGTARTAEKRLKELFGRYPLETIKQCIEAILDGSDKSVSKAASQLPDGEYSFEEYVENSGVEPSPLPLRCKLTIAGGKMTFDFTGTAPQVEGPMNAGPAMAYTGVFNMVKSFLERDTPMNSGAMRSVTVIIEKGTILHALPPAAVAGYSEVCYATEHAFIGVMAQIIPEKTGAPPETGANHTFLSGFDPEKRQHWLAYEYPRGGWPASPTVDGSHVIVTYDLGDIATIVPVERLELDNPVLVLRHELRQDSDGAGYRRGGLGGIREIQVLSPRGALLSLMGQSGVIPGSGVCGGYPGGLNIFQVRRNGKEFHPGVLPSKVSGYPLLPGDVVVERTRGCGGWGDPLDREVERVLEDVWLEYISEKRAHEVYGVVIRNGQVDRAATEALRAQIRSERIYVTIRPAETDLYDLRRCRVCAISPDLARRLGVQEGDLVEYIAKGSTGPHLKGWVSVNSTLQGNEVPLGPVGRRILKANGGDRIWLRPVRPTDEKRVVPEAAFSER
jgi:N-methylhydantoinase B